MTTDATERVETSARWRLKQSTDTAHRRLDAGMVGLDLRKRDDYAAFLSLSAAALVPLEEAIENAASSARPSDWPARRRSGALLDDLQGVGAQAPDPIGVPLLDGARAVGALYVLEGSRLGGQLLRRDAQASDDEIVRSNMRYLSHGSELSWRAFTEWLDEVLAVGDELSAAVEGATEAFATFERALARQLEARE